MHEGKRAGNTEKEKESNTEASKYRFSISKEVIRNKTPNNDLILKCVTPGGKFGS